MADLEYTIADGIGTILLNRPHRKNAFTLEMIDEWAADPRRGSQRPGRTGDRADRRGRRLLLRRGPVVPVLPRW